jgi:hypothetical protein
LILQSQNACKINALNEECANRMLALDYPNGFSRLFHLLTVLRAWTPPAIFVRAALRAALTKIAVDYSFALGAIAPAAKPLFAPSKCFSRIFYPIFWKLIPKGSSSKKLGV